MKKVAIIGAGAWGSALACVCARATHETVLWSRSQEHSKQIAETLTNPRYLADLKLDSPIRATSDLEDTLNGVNMILLSVPTQTLSTVLGAFNSIQPDVVLVTTCKGIDRETGLLPVQLVKQAFADNPVAALSGPSFASDVVRGLPTAVTVASGDIRVADEVSSELSTDTFRCYASNDVRGVELGGALKNVLALAVGAARGMALGASAEAALIARGFAEISRLAVRLGARPETLTGLSGLGDMTLTCSSPQSRNFTYGMAMGRGENLDGLKLAEGAFTASVALRLALENGVDVPITQAIVAVLENRVTAQEAVSQLLTRPLKRES